MIIRLFPSSTQKFLKPKAHDLAVLAKPFKPYQAGPENWEGGERNYYCGGHNLVY